LDIDASELEDGRWFSKEEVKAAFMRVTTNPGIMRNNDKNELFIPPKGAIAHQLLQNWVEDYTPSQL
jgi:NADH pyrophosphatase NudC (nudix superfamily)